MIRAGAAALALMLTVPALPVLAQDDPRLIERMYDPMEVVRIDGRVKVQATIAFDESEAIENVAIGDSNAWQVTPNKRANLLFVKPLTPTAATNMTVVTNKRTYLFDLVASPRSRPLYVMRFLYPKELEETPPTRAEGTGERLASADPAANSASEDELAAMDGAASEPPAVDPADLNFAWATDGDRKLLPARTYDDGQAVYLTWPAGKPVPAILIKDYEGTEGPVNFSVRGDTIVLDGVPREIILRSGRDKASLVNQDPVRSASRPQAALAQSDFTRSGEIK